MTNNSAKGGRRPQFARNVDPCYFSLLDYNPFDILGLDPKIYYGYRALRDACIRVRMHAGLFATSSRLTTSPIDQARLAVHTLLAGYREPAHAFWRAHHRSTWNPHADVGSREAGLPIPGLEGATSAEEADLLMAAAIAAVESDADGEGATLLGAYYPPGCNELGDRSGPIPADYHLLLFSEHGDCDGDSDCELPTLPGVVLGSVRRSVEATNERANAVVAVLDRRGRYYRRVVPWTMDYEPLPVDDDFNINNCSCPPACIEYLPRFRNRSEFEVMALVREELALLQADIDAEAPPGPEAV
ncbi:MAG: hypothetical protein M1826_007684 [Phylliscum demangeonii]|nr:MAG: hypothetical protein M1826_007684 [Phylliscum demangeonii]